MVEFHCTETLKGKFSTQDFNHLALISVVEFHCTETLKGKFSTKDLALISVVEFH